MTHPNNAAHQAAFRHRVLQLGLKEVRHCYAPESSHETIKAFARDHAAIAVYAAMLRVNAPEAT